MGFVRQGTGRRWRFGNDGVSGFFKEVKMERQEKQAVFEVLRCPCCNRRLADAAGKDYVVSLWCRSCKARVLFCAKVQPA